MKRALLVLAGIAIAVVLAVAGYGIWLTLGIAKALH